MSIILIALNPFYIVKLGFTVIFLILLKNIDCGYSLEPLRGGGSNEYPTISVSSKNNKKITFFLSETSFLQP